MSLPYFCQSAAAKDTYLDINEADSFVHRLICSDSFVPFVHQYQSVPMPAWQETLRTPGTSRAMAGISSSPRAN